MDLAVVIVTWNVRNLVLAALRTLQADLEAYGPTAETWVVDNASADGTVEAIRVQFPQVKVIASTVNLGFAGGNNLGMRTIGFGVDAPVDSLPHAVFLLNPDTLIQPHAVRTLYDALMADPQVGIVGARLAYEDGSFQHSAFHFPGVIQACYDLFPLPARFYETPLNGRYPRYLYNGDAPFPVEQVLGATMMIRQEVIRQTGMFDEQFFMYCEEIDWCMRVRRAGWDIRCVPTAQITHLAGKSTSQVRPESFFNLWQSRFRLYQKHYAPLKVALLRQVVRLGMRRKITQARREAACGAITADQRDALITAYRKVAAL